MSIKALFLDRDGTINVDYGYVYQPEKFEFINGIFDLCQIAQEKGYKIIIITNQSGIARGYYTVSDYEKCTQYMIEKFREKGIIITDVFYCPELTGPNRKPNPGLFLQAKEKYDINMPDSVSIGDKDRDIIAAEAAGVGRNFLFKDNYDELKEKL